MNGKKVYVSPRNRMGITKDGSGHFFCMFQGYGLAVSVFEFLKRNGFDEIHLRIGKAETLISSLDDWEQWAIPYRREPYEEQLILPEKHMRKEMLSLAELTP